MGVLRDLRTLLRGAAFPNLRIASWALDLKRGGLLHYYFGG